MAKPMKQSLGESIHQASAGCTNVSAPTFALPSCRAIGRIQLQRLPEWTSIRTRNVLLAEALGDLSVVRVPLPPEYLTHAWYKFYAFVQPEELADGWSRDRIQSEIAALGYPAYPEAAARFTLRSASRMLAWLPPSVCLWPGSLAKPV